LIANNTYGYSGEVLVDLYMAVVVGDAPAERLRRVRDVAGGVCQDIEAQVGSAGCLARVTASIKEYWMVDETTDQAGYGFAKLSLLWGSP
jgi:hypothetical protein